MCLAVGQSLRASGTPMSDSFRQERQLGIRVVNYEWLYRALVRRLVEIADDVTTEDYGMHRLYDYDRVARAHEPNIKEEANVS